MLSTRLFVGLCVAGVSVDAWQIAVKPQLHSRVALRAAVPVLQAAALGGDEEQPQLPDPAPILTTRSMLDTTAKFDEIAAGAASAGSAAAALGREPGTCDPYDPKSSEYCMDDSQQVRPATLYVGGCNPMCERLQPLCTRLQPYACVPTRKLEPYLVCKQHVRAVNWLCLGCLVPPLSRPQVLAVRGV